MHCDAFLDIHMFFLSFKTHVLLISIYFAMGELHMSKKFKKKKKKTFVSVLNETNK